MIGGQACILYGASEFSRDVDFAIMLSPENLKNIKSILSDLNAQQIYVPQLSPEMLEKGHACHFRCRREDVEGIRIDLINVMKGVDSFQELWTRRTIVHIPEVGDVPVMNLRDIVQSKKTQRDKDWPMIRRLVETDIFNAGDDPDEDKIRFWLSECRTASLICDLAQKYNELARDVMNKRPLLKDAMESHTRKVEEKLLEEEMQERKKDREYWKPLRRELTQLRHERGKRDA